MDNKCRRWRNQKPLCQTCKRKSKENLVKKVDYTNIYYISKRLKININKLKLKK